ncbi:sugar phosphate isomerase/epimerase family protein [Flavilitoribacter nigricans]|uniref:Xylose isomerase n=1 Tax=Flavilitoribacter nigricans (strain ATCC 23147 / DSM 23189 / NBRC 102662 / NCIMB 1420 / SS-2) TaxID=1122177 RepID=A0A2D0NCS0_FLAN2|nr:TIM barrel protein [Flavilitoribacter nigricans]PHN06277.1 xylose isomerase [Flavilitoribacter nigricans DSM 23189 = NBRC 102662]
MKNPQQSGLSRRRFIGTSTALITGAAVGGHSLIGAPAILKHYGSSGSKINGVQIGVITYSFRSLPDQSAEATLQYIVDSGISAVELMGDPAEYYAGKPENPVDRRAFFGLMRASRNGELTDNQKKEMEEMRAQMNAYDKEVAIWRATASMDKFKEVKKMFKASGVKIYGFKPNAFGKGNTDAEINYGMRAAKALGASHVTLEHPSDDAHTMRLGMLAKKNKVYVGYHGHEQQTPDFWDTALQQSSYNALNIDIGHYVAAGNDKPLDILKAKHDRIMSMHVKDRQTPANGKKNLPWGEGDTPITQVLQLMRDQKYKFPATVELEYEVPEGSDAVKEVKKCLEYCRKALQA